MSSSLLVVVLSLFVVSAQAALFLTLAAASLLAHALPEKFIGLFAKTTFLLSTLASLALFAVVTLGGGSPVVVPLGEWLATASYHFELSLLVDPLSVTYVTLTAALCGIVGAFAHSYLHRERGFNRFFVLLALFALGMTLTSLAGSLELIFASWELVGLSSALLIAFHHERPAPAKNGLRTFIVYRICDLGLLAAVALSHYELGTGDLELLFRDLPELESGVPTVLALLLLLAACGKSAQIPFSGWLPRAMEGPTPSSAVFYGALSVHAGAFLLLRVSPVLDRSLVASAAVVLVGLLTALHATLSGRVQTDIKTALAYASLTQVGIIFIEIGLGFRLLPLLHLVGNAMTRTLQFLRAPSLLHDFHQLQNAVGGHLARTGLHLERSVPSSLKRRLYLLSLERAHLDDLADRYAVAPFLALFGFLDGLERRGIERLGGVKRG
ncbi:MAG TPA: proton-conducting transporter membrane subunit [Vicinamibacteria bacterium]|nr:proton-conducting transporter membrane subunit [Vicinamibacteria bacterium]